MDGGPAREGDGGRRQAMAGVGVVGRIPDQIGAAQVPIEGGAQPVDDRGVGLEPHAELESSDEDAGDGGALAGLTRLLLDDGGQDQGLFRARQGQTGGAVPPLLGQDPIHGLGGTAQDIEIAGALGKAVGIGKEAALGMLTRPAQGGHQVLGRGPLQFAHQAIILGQGRQDLGRGPALDEGDGALVNLVLDQLVEQGHRGRAGADLVFPGLDPPRVTPQIGQGEEVIGMVQHPQGRQLLGQGAQGHAMGDLEQKGLLRTRRGREGQGTGLEGLKVVTQPQPGQA